MRDSRTTTLFLLSAVMILGGATCGPNTSGDGADGGETSSGPRTNPELGNGDGGSPMAKVALGPDGQPLPSGLVFTVGEGVPEGGRKEPAPPAEAKALPDDEAKLLLSRLPAIDAQGGDQVDFALRPGSKPPPLTGDTIQAPFPPPHAPDVTPTNVPTGPPTVLRYQPEGDVPLAPRITITFSNPMVPVTSHDTLAAEGVPVTLTPTIEGNWHWVGTKTLFFDPVGRAPMATEFKAEVKAGTKDALGQPLAEAKSWTFRTPPPSLQSSMPQGDAVELEPVLYASFDQKIDAAALLAKLTVTAGDEKVGVRELTKEEYDKLPEAWRTDKDNVGRWLAFKLKKKLSTSTTVVVTFPKGTPSAEGPRVTEQDQSFSFKTYGPLELIEARCGWGNDNCRPGMAFTFRFSNPIDEDALEDKQVTVDPPILGLSADVYGDTLNLSGLTKGKTSYKITFSGSLKDVYGQTLGKDEVRTINVGPSERMLSSTLGAMIVLDPMSKKRRVPVYVMNYPELEVELYKVDPAKHWSEYQRYVREHWQDDGPKTPPGERVFAKTIPTGMTPEELSQVDIDLTPALTGDFGQVIVLVRPKGGGDSDQNGYRRDREQIVSWVQVTQLGLDAWVDSAKLVGWTTALQDGKPLAGVELTLDPTGQKVTTDTSGLGDIALPSSSLRQMLIAKKGDDVAFLPDSDYSWDNNGQWIKREPVNDMRWMVFDDRQLYRPSETVSIKGIVRLVEPGAKGDVVAIPAGQLTKVSWSVVESQGNELMKGTADVSLNGTFSLQFKLPDTPNLGGATVHFTTGLTKYTGNELFHAFQIQEFRRPEFEVSTTVSDGPHIVGGKANISLTASYFAGGPLPNAHTTWSVSSTRGYFTPPNQSDFVFGTWEPWWGWRDEWGGPTNDGGSYKSVEGRTDASGTHVIGLSFESVSPPRATSINAEATVQDVNRQTWSTSATLLVHPASYYVGLKTARYFVDQGMPIDIDAIVADLDGKRVAGTDIELTMVRLDYKKVKKKGWQEVEADPETCKIVSAKDAVRCTFKPKLGGRHKITAKIVDPEKRPNESEVTVWVPGGKVPTDRDLKMEAVQVIPSKQKYEVGETVELMLQAPFYPASGVYSIRRGDMVENTPIAFDGPSQTIKIKVEEWMIPGFSVHVSLDGSAVRQNDDGTPNDNLPKRPAFAEGGLQIEVPATLRRLTVEAVPAAAKIEPGAETTVTVTVKDADGKVVPNAEVALVVVDESVLALAGYTMADPIGVFYSQRGDYTRNEHSRSRLVLSALKELFAQNGRDNDADGIADMKDMAKAGMGPGGGGRMRAEMAPSPVAAMAMEEKPKEPEEGSVGSQPNGPIAVRKNFDALAVFAPDVPTDADGRALVKVKVPDNLTRYRVMAVALSGANHFGSGESSITARLPLMVRMSPPRFLNFGDTFELPVVLQNQTDEPLEVRVAVRSTNATVDQGAGRLVTIAPNDRAEVRFPMSAMKAGTARFQAGATAGRWSDAAEVKLPVWTPATTEGFATYGEIDQGGVVQPVELPGEVWTQFGGIQVQTSSTQLQALTDAVLYLTKYPFECSEQLSSRIMSIAALRDVLSAFESAELPSADVLIASVAEDIKQLHGMQADDGGFAFWRRDQETWPFLTVHVAHALVRAKAKGFEVPGGMLDAALSYMRDIRSHMTDPLYSEPVKRAIESYSLYVRARAGDVDAARAQALLKEGGGLDKVDLEMVGWLYPVLVAGGATSDVEAIRKHLNNRVSETAGAAHFVTSYGDGAYLLLHSDRRVDGLLLEDLIADQPKSDLIPKIVRGLLAHRTKGRWENTQESAWVLLGLDTYFNTYEKTEPSFVARVWLGDGYAGDHAFKGRSTERYEIDVPMAKLAELGGKQNLTIAKEGAGRLYYRVGMTYAPKSLTLAPSEHGFHVERLYEGADDPKDVTKNADGSWTVKAGARVRVKLTMHTEDRRYHVALVDPMPAGFEALNPELRGTQGAPPRNDDKTGGLWDEGDLGRSRYYWWWGPWYEHENLRDERAEAFTSLLWEGVYTYTYYTRATTLGTFVVPPPKAEEMYAPETFGRGASDRVVVK